MPNKKDIIVSIKDLLFYSLLALTTLFFENKPLGNFAIFVLGIFSGFIFRSLLYLIFSLIFGSKKTKDKIIKNKIIKNKITKSDLLKLGWEFENSYTAKNNKIYDKYFYHYYGPGEDFPNIYQLSIDYEQSTIRILHKQSLLEEETQCLFFGKLNNTEELQVIMDSFIRRF